MGFWKVKKLKDFSNEEWEQICCNCGLCCLIKLQNEEDDEVYYTRIICHLFDKKSRLCKEYKNRCTLVPECLKVTPENIDKLEWMPKNCAYRILNETGDLPLWHPLKKESVDLPKLPENLVCDILVDEDSLEDYIVEDEVF
jgi:uncharacterized cysteine cluster protein YcgN (CxxCxxCC family)